ncbi:MAG TPA: homoserine dehydrogenase [bacterium]|nr:homoserine dehydrogenase [bacterium]
METALGSRPSPPGPLAGGAVGLIRYVAMKMLRVGILGLGTVGAEVLRLLADETIAQRANVRLTPVAAAVADPGKARPPLPRLRLTGEARQVVEAPDVDVVVELIGGLEPARSLVLRALELGKPVVTANKQLLAEHGPELFERAAARGVPLRFEGSVGAGIPLIAAIQESLAAARIHAITGILNGTTNYILTRMALAGWGFEEALAEAQRRGFAEAQPSDDIDGHDAAAKLAILASAAFGCRVTGRDVYREGIAGITPRDMAYARELEYAIKLLAIGRLRDGDVEVRVHPALIPLHHPLAQINDEFNALEVEGDGLGPVVFSGRGAGGPPTAVAVLGDLIAIARADGRAGAPAPRPLAARRIRPMEEVVLPFYLNLQVTDRPGVFARVATVFGEEQVSIASIVQKSRGEVAEVIFLTHDAPERAVRRVLARLRGLDVVKAVSSVIRVEATL